MRDETEKKNPDPNRNEDNPVPVQWKPHPWLSRSKPDKVHGARMSKTNPAVDAQLEHEMRKMQIFRLFMLLIILFAVILTISALITYFRNKKARDEQTAARIAGLDLLEARFARTDLTPYEKEQAAAQALQEADLLAAAVPDVRKDMEHRITEYERILRNSYPVPAPAGKRGTGFICSSGMLDMVPIAAGKFVMGRSEKQQDGKAKFEAPQHEITIATPFWMARTEVSVWQIRRLIPAFRVTDWGEYKLGTPRQPAAGVRWDQAILYCKKLTELEQRAGRIPDGYEYRLPTEAEWEYACRAGSSTVYPWGDDFGDRGGGYANGLDRYSAKKFDWHLTKYDPAASNDKYRVSAPVGSLKPNAWGLYDMLGNVSEWCYDWYSPRTYRESKVFVNPLQISAEPVVYTQYRAFDDGTWDTELPCKVLRGGSWGVAPEKLRSAARDFMPPNEVNKGVGFRPVLAPVIRNRLRN